MKIISEKNRAQLKEIVLLHDITKHFILLGEETDLNFSSYLQPIKEFRDSHEHILRIFRKVLFKSDSEDDIYIEKQLSKALGHEYRAFFDVADWFSIICRKSAYEAIENKQRSIHSITIDYPEYKYHVEIIENAGSQIAEIRGKKDVGGTITELINVYQELMLQIYNSMLYIRRATILFESDLP